MDGPRAPSENEYNDLIQFLNHHLRPECDWSIIDEYPTAFHPSNRNNIRIIKEDDSVLSHAVVKPLIIKTPYNVFKISAIGSVVTDSQSRNKGLSQKVIQESLKVARAHDSDLAILWTNIYDFYRKFGFELSGFENIALINKKLETKSNNKVLKKNQIDPAAIHKLYSKHTVTSFRTLEDFSKYLKIPNMRVYTSWKSNGQIAAYAIEGKGADFDGYIHEWGGEIPDLMNLLNHIREDQDRDLHIIIPEHSKNFIFQLKQQNVDIIKGHLGMVKMIHADAFLAKIKKYVIQNFKRKDFILEKNQDHFVMGFDKDIFMTKNENELLQIILGPTPIEKIHTFSPENHIFLKTAFPIPLWIWGWDSV